MPRRHALAWAAAALLAAPAAQALDVFTAQAPVYVGSWFNGTTTETHEFQFAADWAGWCNARANASCQSIAFWNVAGNWDNNAIPNRASGVARIEVGQTVRVGSFNSLYRGPISGGAIVGTLSAAGRVEVDDHLGVVNASFADLFLYPVIGQLDTTGLSAVNRLSSGQGRFGGAGGTTQLGGWSLTSGGLNVLVLENHTLKLAGVAAAPVPLDIRLVPTARLVNLGMLDIGGGQVRLQGSANVDTLPVFDNTGTISGDGAVSLHFNNAGTVNMAAGGSLAFSANGTHSGSFSGSAGSTMAFGGLFAGSGHRFLGAVNSGGDVTLSRGIHQASGAWNVARTFVQGGGEITFDGPAPQIGALHVNGGGLHKGAMFNSAGGSTLQSVFVDNSGVVEFNAGSSTAQHLTLRDGRLTNQGPLQVAQRFDWHSGALTGAGTMHLPGQTTLHAGTRIMNTNIVLDGSMDWQGGSFSAWAGHMDVLSSGRVDIGGDFGSAGGGSLLNRGTITKQAGTGRSALAMVVNSNAGVFRATTGTLALTGGGMHNRATFDAAPGARIELSGGNVFGSSINVSGPLDVAGGSFELLAGVQHAHAAGNRFNVRDVRIGSGARLQLADPLVASGSVYNFGSFAPAGSVTIAGDFNQQGAFALARGASLWVGGHFNNSAPLTLTDSQLTGTDLYNPSTLRLAGVVSADLGRLQNAGMLAVVPDAPFGRVTMDDSLNTGTLHVEGATTSVRAYGNSFINNGVIVNEGDWVSDTSFRHFAGARMDNIGVLRVGGDLALAQGSRIANAGSLEVVDNGLSVGRVFIDAGATLEGSGSYRQRDGLTVVNGLLRADGGITIDAGTLKGTGTAQGPLTLGPTADWQLGNSPGTFTVLGDAALEGRLEVEVQSPAVHDRLVVSGNFTAYSGSAIDLIFDAGFQPSEGDTINWLQAGSTTLGGSVNTSGLPADWSASLNPTNHAVEITYDLADAIPLSGDHSIAAGAVGFNAVPGWNNQPNLNSLQNDGTFSNRTGATAAASMLNNASGGVVVNRGGLDVRTLNNAGSFQNRPGSLLTVSTLNNSGHLGNEGTVQSDGDFNNAAGAVFEQRGEMQINQRVTNDGRLVVAGRLSGPYAYNGSGDVVIEAGGSFEGSAGGWFWTSGGNVRVDGLLAAGDIRISNNGNARLSGTGRLQGNVESFADIDPGNSIGQLTVDGDLNSRGSLNLEIESANAFDRLVVTGNATLGDATMYLLGSYRPVLGDRFDFISVAGMLQIGNPLNWVVLRLVDPEDSASGWTPWANPDGIFDANVPADWRAEFDQGTLSITAVPEPATWALWLAGLVAVARIARQRVA